MVLACRQVAREDSATGSEAYHSARSTPFSSDQTASNGLDAVSAKASTPTAHLEYVVHPAFPELPATVPLTFTLTMHACLSLTPSERPSFEQVRRPRRFGWPSWLQHSQHDHRPVWWRTSAGGTH